MQTNQNQPSNLARGGGNNTTNYFNNYFSLSTEISQNINDAILSYFEQQTGNRASAMLLVQAVIDTAKSQREDPMTVLAEFQKMPPGDLNAVLCLYLNISRVNTSLLGVRSQPRVNTYVTRLIVV